MDGEWEQETHSVSLSQAAFPAPRIEDVHLFIVG